MARPHARVHPVTLRVRPCRMLTCTATYAHLPCRLAPACSRHERWRAVPGSVARASGRTLGMPSANALWLGDPIRCAPGTGVVAGSSLARSAAPTASISLTLGFKFFLLPPVPAARCRQAESTPAPAPCSANANRSAATLSLYGNVYCVHDTVVLRNASHLPLRGRGGR